MPNKVESIPQASLLLASLRSVGYSEETAIADILDNCITAGATEINIDFNWEKQAIFIIDNGHGMSYENLIKNMRIGSADPNETRDENDLGRFGMGMKTAAFSLGKKLTVLTQENNAVSNATWDLDAVLDIGWKLIVSDDDMIKDRLPLLHNKGTVVIIENLDRVIDSKDLIKAKRKFYKIIEKVEKHISVIFHRYINDDGIVFRVNGKLVVGWDPFVTQNSATQELAEEEVWSESGESCVLIQPYVLPHKTKFENDSDYELAGGTKGWNQHQGLYVYRNRRLIIYGTWFDYIKKEPAYNLARIRIDISATNDDEWKIDIKKSSAALPVDVKESVERAIERCVETSAKVYNSRGAYSKRNVTAPNLNYVWEQQKKNGRYSFHINRKHTLLSDIKQKLDRDGIAALSAYLALIENFAPFMHSGVTESMQKTDSRVIDTNSLEYKMQLKELKEYIALFLEKGFTREETKSTLLEMANYKHLHKEIVEMLEGVK